MARVLTERSIYFSPLQILYDVINQNVPDINPVRSSEVKESSRRWIFPTTPEANDENYPRIAIIHGQPTFEEMTAGQHLEYVTQPSAIQAVNTNIAVIPFTIGIFCKKTAHKPYEVLDPDGTRRWVENSAQVAWLLDKTQREIHRNRRSFIERDMDVKITSVEGTYEDNDFLWAGEINGQITMKNIWTEDIDKVIGSFAVNIFDYEGELLTFDPPVISGSLPDGEVAIPYG